MTNTNSIVSYDKKITELTNIIFDIQVSVDNSVILREVEDRLARRNNALFLGIEEPPTASSTERQTNDLNQVKGICEILSNNLIISFCSRIGKYSFNSLHRRP